MLWYTSTTEKGLADLLREESGFRITGEVAKGDKFVRAQPVAAAWCAGNVLLPRKASWIGEFVTEVCGFTGVHDRHDDQVDALAAAFDRLHAPPLPRGMGQTQIMPF
jgi:predicted phage terminase large subunit-like protein